MKYTLDPSVNKNIIFLPRPDFFSSSAEDGSGSGAKAQKALVSGNNRCPMGRFSITFSPLSLCFHQLFYWGLVCLGLVLVSGTNMFSSQSQIPSILQDVTQIPSIWAFVYLQMF